jgi:hypothetical protein
MTHSISARHWRLVLQSLSAALVLTSCVQTPTTRVAGHPCDTASPVNPAAARPGLGGTGIDVAGRPGLGGTGIDKGADKGGVGGTGIVGVITGFASVCVNGVEVHYDASTPVTSNGTLSSVSQLAVGQVVLVNAQGQGTQLKAQSITALYAVVGPVQTVDAAQRRLRVLGQPLRLDEDIDMRQLQPGTWVQASGHRLASGEIVVGSVERIAPQAQARLSGRITRIEPGALYVEGVRVVLSTQSMPANTVVSVGMEAAVSGVWNGAQLQAQQVELQPTRSGLGTGARVVLQGYVHSLRGRELSVGYSNITLSPDVQISSELASKAASGLALNQRVQISGRIDSEQRVLADRVQVQSEGGGEGSGKSSSNRGSGNSGSSNSGKGSGSSGSGNSGSGSSGSGSNSGSGASSGSGSGSSGSGSGSGGSSGSGSGGGGSSGGGGHR